jgi:ribosomal protein S18 acetylase RimI-like enzyme
VREMRRLEKPGQGGLCERLTRSPLRGFEISEADCRLLETEKSYLVASDEGGVVALLPRVDGLSLHYGFTSLEAFRNGFPGLLARAAKAAQGEEVIRRIDLQLDDLPNRTFIEPVLSACGFELRDEWFEMILPEVPPDAASPPFPRGYRLRPLVEADAAAFVKLSEAAYAEPPAPLARVREYIATAAVMRGVEAAGGALVGAVRLSRQPPATGYADDLAVHPEHQNRGLGTALMRWAVAWLVGQGLRRGRLHVRSDNGPALCVYRKAGFTVSGSGLSYARPLDEAEVERARKKRPGTYIKFGGWR